MGDLPQEVDAIVADSAETLPSRSNLVESASSDEMPPLESSLNGDVERKSVKTQNVKPAATAMVTSLKDNDSLPTVAEVTIYGPGPIKPTTIQVTSTTSLSDIVQVVCNRPDVCYKTCFSTFVNGQEIKEYKFLCDIPEYKYRTEIHLIEKPYTAADINIHVMRLRELLFANSQVQGSILLDNILAKLKYNVPFRMTRDCLPPSWILPDCETENGGVSLAHLFSDKTPNAKPCISDLWYSRWDPPPPERKIRGDIAYLYVIRLDGVTHHITATSSGFFLNKCTSTHFDPTPADSPYKSYTLVGLLGQVMPSFKKAFDRIIKMTKTVDPLALIPLDKEHWVSVRRPFYPGLQSRIQELTADTLRYGQNHFWTEELLRAKELSHTTLHQKVEKAKYQEIISKDFLMLALRAAVAVVEGEITTPFVVEEDEKSRMFLWNNIVLTFPADMKDSLDDNIGGEEAARASARIDLAALRLLNSFESNAVQSILSAIVWYRGNMILAQAIIPGCLLQNESDQYSPLKSGPNESLDLFSKEMKLRPHKVLNEKGETITVTCPSDIIGVVALDKRLYVTNLFRIFPPDVNFLHVPRVEDPRKRDKEEDKKEEKSEEKVFEFPVHRHKVLVHRGELVQAFTESKQNDFMKAIANSFKSALEAKAARNAEAAKTKEVESKKDGGENDASDAKAETKTVEAIEASGQEKSAVSETNGDIGANGSEIDEAETIEASGQEKSAVSETNGDVEANGSEIDKAETKIVQSNETIEASGQEKSETNGDIGANSSEIDEAETKIVQSNDAIEASGQEKSETNGDIEANSSEIDETKETKQAQQFALIDVNNPEKIWLMNRQSPDLEMIMSSDEIVAKAASTVGSTSETDFSLCFNPDIYSGAKLADTEEDLHRDKFAAQEVSDFLLNTSLKRFVESLGQRNFIVYDGVWLSSALQASGINIRYLGKLAVDIEKNSNLNYIFRIVMCEMLSRSAKHILREEMSKVPEPQLYAATARFLNCTVGSCSKFTQQSQSLDNLFPGGSGGAKKGKNKKQKGPSQQESSLKRTERSVSSWTSLTPSKFWKQLVKEVKAYFGYPIQDCFEVGNAVAKYGISRIALLRRVCQSLGIQILAKDYHFESTKRPPFNDEDVLKLFPLVKSINATDFEQTALKTVCESASKQLAAGNAEMALELLADAQILCESVYGPLCATSALLHRLLGKSLYVQKKFDQAILLQRKALIISERVQGIDHPETIGAYICLGLYCNSAGLIDVALKLFYRARYLSLIAFGPEHPSLAELDTNIALILHNAKEFQSALLFAQNSLKLCVKHYGSDSVKAAASHHLVAQVLAKLGDYRQAMNEERQTVSIYSEKIDPNDERMLTSRTLLNVVTQEAVRIQKQVNELKAAASVK